MKNSLPTKLFNQWKSPILWWLIYCIHGTFKGYKFRGCCGDFTIPKIFILEFFLYQDTFQGKDTSESQNRIAKSFKCRLPSMKYESLRNYCIYGVGLAMRYLMYSKNSSTTPAITGDVFCLRLHWFWYVYWYWTPFGINHLIARKLPAWLVEMIVSDNQPFP